MSPKTVRGTLLDHARNQLLLVAAAALTAACFVACETPHRALRVGDDSATLTVTMNGLKQDDQGKAGWVYELSGCAGIPTLDGVLQTASAGAVAATTTPSYGDTPAPGADLVTFTSPGLQTGLEGCQFRVKVLQAAPTQSFIYEPDTLYWTRQLDITEDQDGALVATAALQIVYTTKPASGPVYNVTVPVKFPAADPGKVFVGALACTPEVGNPGAYTATSATEGAFAFVVPAADLVCTDLYVSVDSKLQKYHTALAASAGKIHVPDGGATLPEQTLTLQLVSPPPTPSSAGVTVSTVAGSCTGDDRHYDESQFQCVCNDPAKTLVNGSCN